MANYTLFLSALVCTKIHIAFMIIWYDALRIPQGPYLYIVIICALATSLWNHGVTNKVAKWTDRLCIACGSLVDLYFVVAVPMNAITNLELYSFLNACSYLLWIFSLSCFFIAKMLIKLYPSLHLSDTGQHSENGMQITFHTKKCQFIRNLPHVLSHATITVMHVLLLYRYFLASKYPLLDHKEN